MFSRSRAPATTLPGAFEPKPPAPSSTRWGVSGDPPPLALPRRAAYGKLGGIWGRRRRGSLGYLPRASELVRSQAIACCESCPARGAGRRSEDVRDSVGAGWHRRASEQRLRKFLNERRESASVTLSQELG